MKITNLILSALLFLLVAGCKPSESDNSNASNANTNMPAVTNNPAITNK